MLRLPICSILEQVIDEPLLGLCPVPQLVICPFTALIPFNPDSPGPLGTIRTWVHRSRILGVSVDELGIET